jgi:uncharacterized membrane protein
VTGDAHNRHPMSDALVDYAMLWIFMLGAAYYYQKSLRMTHYAMRRLFGGLAIICKSR